MFGITYMCFYTHTFQSHVLLFPQSQALYYPLRTYLLSLRENAQRAIAELQRAKAAAAAAGVPGDIPGAQSLITKGSFLTNRQNWRYLNHFWTLQSTAASLRVFDQQCHENDTKAQKS